MRTLPIGQRATAFAIFTAIFVVACGGAGNEDPVKKSPTATETGLANTTLRVDAADANGDALNYQWRVTAGTVSNQNSKETVWSLPEGPGSHFAYVLVSDGRGGYAEQQYVVATDGFRTAAPVLTPVSYTAPAVAAGEEFDGGGARLRLRAGHPSSGADFSTAFATGSTTATRWVYLPSIQVNIKNAGGQQVFAGETDIGGELAIPRLADGQTFSVTCTTSQGTVLAGCSSITGSKTAAQSLEWPVSPVSSSGRSLLLFGHIGLQDGGVCGMRNEFFGVQTTATVQLFSAAGAALSPAINVNSFGDYALDAAVAVNAALQLRVACEGYATTLNISAPAGGYTGAAPVELSHVIPNSRPVVTKMLANGPDGNVRGEMVVPLAGAYSNSLPGSSRFLTYKGADTRLSACLYYRSLGAVRECDAQGNMIGAISLDDWKRANKFGPYRGTNAEVSATYINQRDLNLVRKMVATQTAPNKVAFYVCNHPGPKGDTQRETDQVVTTALNNEKMVACVAMEYSPTAGRSGGNAFTKFLTFGPDGKLLASVNLDGRGEKYLPGACVACHGGPAYAGRFADRGNPTPDLQSNFLPFDTGNYLFASAGGMTEASQSSAIYALNQLVKQTAPTRATNALINGWYANSGATLDKSYVPSAWTTFDPTTAGINATAADAARFYHEVVGTSCRTCHAAMRDAYDWDFGVTRPQLLNYKSGAHVCGGSADLYSNGAMPNALMSLDRLRVRMQADSSLADLMSKFLGCSQADPDPVYPRR